MPVFRLVMVLILAVATSAQNTAGAGELEKATLPTAAKRDADAVTERIASRFNEYRKEAGFKPLRRFHCRYMAQLACSAAVTGQAAKWSEIHSEVYWTADAAGPSEPLRKIAQYDPKPYQDSGIHPVRFSVAVWPTAEPKGYWIGIDLHENELKDAFDIAAGKILGCQAGCGELFVPACKDVR